VDRFNCGGIDGLLEGRHTGRLRKITPGQSAEYEELIRFPERVNQTHWTGKKFHGHLIKELEQKIGYRTVMRWLHDQGFRLKVPRPWPNGQDEEKRKAFVEVLQAYLADPELDIWYLDETGIEGDPRPRRRWEKGVRRSASPVRAPIYA
jgi:transposase